MPAFTRYIGIHYSGAEIPDEPLPYFSVYLGEGDWKPLEVAPVPAHKHWSRNGIAAWLVERLEEGTPTLIGIDHAFSFPLRYFEAHGLKLEWALFLDDFQRHCAVAGEGGRGLLRECEGRERAHAGSEQLAETFMHDGPYSGTVTS